MDWRFEEVDSRAFVKALLDPSRVGTDMLRDPGIFASELCSMTEMGCGIEISGLLRKENQIVQPPMTGHRHALH